MESPPSPSDVRRDLADEFGAAARPSQEEMLDRYRDFAAMFHSLYGPARGRPGFLRAIEDGTVDFQAVAAMLVGMPVESWTAVPASLS